jgi:uncharacterized phiE125 gp8 family phage protein
MMSAMLLSAPASEPLALADVKAHLRLDSADEDTLVIALILAARQWIERRTGRKLISQRWRVMRDAWPVERMAPGLILPIPFAPLISVDAVRVVDPSGATVLVNPVTYVVDPSDSRPRLAFLNLPPAPGQPINGISLDLTVGYGTDPAMVPEPLRQAMRLLVTDWFEHRGDDASAKETNADIEALIAPYQRRGL